MKSLPSDKIIGADNPGEFKYIGEDIKARAVMFVTKDGDVVDKPVDLSTGTPIDEELIKKKGGVAYYQMGGSLPDNLYNRDSSGKPTRDPGIGEKGKGKDSSNSLEKNLDKKEKKGDRWYKTESLTESFEEEDEKERKRVVNRLITNAQPAEASSGIEDLKMTAGMTTYGMVVPRDAKEMIWLHGDINLDNVRSMGDDKDRAIGYATSLKKELESGEIDPIFVEVTEIWSDYSMEYRYKFEIIDGNHRASAAKILGIKTLPGYLILPKSFTNS